MPTLRVGAALPDPPFELLTKQGPAGFDIALMQRIAEKLGRTWQLVRYGGSDFNGIFAGLDDGSYDCVASGTTITPGRQQVADFCAPYAVSGQSLGGTTSKSSSVSVSQAVRSRCLNASTDRRRSSTFSSDIAYSDSPAASRASDRSENQWAPRTFPCRTVKTAQ